MHLAQLKAASPDGEITFEPLRGLPLANWRHLMRSMVVAGLVLEVVTDVYQISTAGQLALDAVEAGE